MERARDDRQILLGRPVAFPLTWVLIPTFAVTALIKTYRVCDDVRSLA
jgi:hypothetical protein